MGGKAARGFTLIELLLVLVLLGLSSGVAVVSVGQLVTRWQERSVVSDVLSVLKMARVSAMESGRTVVVEVGGEASAVLTVRGGNRNKTLVLKAPFEFSSSGGPVHSYLFWPDGSLEAGHLDLLDSGRLVHRFTLNGVSARIQ